MIFEEAKKKLKGLAVVLVTPWTKSYKIDFEGLRENVRFIMDCGVREGKGAFFVACAGGENMFMTSEEIKEAIKTVVEEVDGKTPVFFGTFYNSIESTIDLLKFGEKIGAYGAQVAPPYYTRPTLDEIFDFFKKLNSATELGITVYNNYYSNGTDMPTQFVERMATLDKVIGFKWMSTTRANSLMTISKFKDRFNFFSNDIAGSIAEKMAGTKGLVSLIANFAPEYDLMLWNLLEKGEYIKAFEHMMKFTIPYYQLVSYEQLQTSPSVGVANFWKAAMEICGRPSGGVRPPQRPLAAAQETRLKEILVKAGFAKQR